MTIDSTTIIAAAVWAAASPGKVLFTEMPESERKQIISVVRLLRGYLATAAPEKLNREATEALLKEQFPTLAGTLDYKQAVLIFVNMVPVVAGK